MRVNVRRPFRRSTSGPMLAARRHAWHLQAAQHDDDSSSDGIMTHGVCLPWCAIHHSAQHWPLAPCTALGAVGGVTSRRSAGVPSTSLWSRFSTWVLVGTPASTLEDPERVPARVEQPASIVRITPATNRPPATEFRKILFNASVPDHIRLLWASRLDHVVPAARRPRQRTFS